jgi:hypothetical protein
MSLAPNLRHIEKKGDRPYEKEEYSQLMKGNGKRGYNESPNVIAFLALEITEVK